MFVFHGSWIAVVDAARFSHSLLTKKQTTNVVQKGYGGTILMQTKTIPKNCHKNGPKNLQTRAVEEEIK